MMNGSASLPPDAEANDRQRQVLTVSQLNNQIRDRLQRAFASVWVSGEIVDLARPQSGHLYFSLKDAQGQLRAVMWRSTAARLRFEPRDGMEVVCEGQIDVYPPRGTYQLIVRQLEPLGVGALQLALLQLRDRLAAEGLFDPARKRPLPRYPRRIAVVTSPTGAAIRDFLEVIRRRWRGVQVTIVPTRVQGTDATPEIVRAIEIAQTLQPTPDVLVVTRGGGSLEDLWCFNEESVVRAIHESRIPVISAIGHEIDVTLADLVADVRALTPTEAGERVVPDQDEVREQLLTSAHRLRMALARRSQLARARLEALGERTALLHPERQLRDLTRRVDDWQQRMTNAMQVRLSRATDRVVGLAHRVEVLSPLAVLGRGYSVTLRESDGRLVRDARQLETDELLQTRLHRGSVLSRVVSVSPDADSVEHHNDCNSRPR